uniref:Uncharacterized protein n=1 Tax=Fagus sylvatica TaxID=28930 RepID=A0A2N9IH56_FAGSY
MEATTQEIKLEVVETQGSLKVLEMVETQESLKVLEVDEALKIQEPNGKLEVVACNGGVVNFQEAPEVHGPNFEKENAVPSHPMVGDFEKSRALPKAKVESSWEYIEAWPIEVRMRFLNSRSLAKKESINKVIQVPSRYWLIGRSPLMKKQLEDSSSIRPQQDQNLEDKDF